MTYSPDPEVSSMLGGIVELLGRSRDIVRETPFARDPALLAMLPGGELYFDSSMELDTDGLPTGAARGAPDWQGETSLRYADGSSLDPDRVPYFVLPLPREWPNEFGIDLGDYAAVLRGRHISYAVFGDFGHNPGEGSIELFRRLGAERLKGDGSIIDSGVGKGVVTIVFPGSGLGRRPSDENELLADLLLQAPRLFSELGGLGSARDAAPLLSPDVPIPIPLAIPLAPGLGARVARLAEDEFERYGTCAEDQSPLRERIGQYWKALDRDHDGADHAVFWSAAFVSYMVRLAGGDEAFHCSSMHSRYVHQAILDRDAGRTGRYWGYRTGELRLEVGDVLAMNRGDGPAIDFDEAGTRKDYPSHADIVTSVDGDGIHTVGGNVGKAPGTVGRKCFRWSADALRNVKNAEQQVHAVLRPPAA